MKEEEEEGDAKNGFFDEWERESLHSNNHDHHFPPPPPPSSSSSSSSSPSSSHFLSPLQITTHHHKPHLTIFPPVNHEDLPIPIPIPISQSTLSLSYSPPSSPPPPPLPPRNNNTQLLNCFDFALNLLNSKLLSILTHIRSSGFLSFFRPVATLASVLGFLWFWVRWRMRKSGGGERVEQLKLLIKEKDEILRLLEQIAEMNKALLTRYRIPVLKPS